MQSIEENTERLDLLQRTFQVEQKQIKRLMDLSSQKNKEIEKSKTNEMYEGYSNNTSTTSMLEQEETQRKLLVEEMISSSTPTNAPTVKVLTNLQGNFHIYVLILDLIININKKITYLFIKVAWGS